MYLDAFLFVGREDQLPHCELKVTRVKGEPEADPRDIPEFVQLVAQLEQAGEPTEAFIGDAAVRLDSLVEVLPVIGEVCYLHEIPDPTEVRDPNTDDFLLHGGSLL